MRSADGWIQIPITIRVGVEQRLHKRFVENAKKGQPVIENALGPRFGLEKHEPVCLSYGICTTSLVELLATTDRVPFPRTPDDFILAIVLYQA